MSQHWFVLFVLDGGWSSESFLRKKMCFLSSKTRCQCSGSFKNSLRLLSTCNWSLWWRLISSQRHKMAYCGLERTLVGRPFRYIRVYTLRIAMGWWLSLGVVLMRVMRLMKYFPQPLLRSIQQETSNPIV